VLKTRRFEKKFVWPASWPQWRILEDAGVDLLTRTAGGVGVRLHGRRRGGRE
jgi:hypothetical protein